MPGRLYTPIILRQPLRITTVALSNASAGTAYTATLAGSGGITPYTWRLLSQWPGSWLSLNASTGVLSGTPPNPEIDVLAIQLTDSLGTSTTAVLMLSTPTTVSANTISASEIDLSWVTITGATTYNVRRNGTIVFSGPATSFNDTGLTASTTYSYTVSGVGIYGEGAQSAAINATTQSGAPVTALAQPVAIPYMIGGDQSYGCNASTSYQNWLTAPVGSAAYNFIQNAGAYDGALLSGVFEGTSGDWDSNHARNRENLTLALGKDASLTYQTKINRSRKTLAWYYHIMNSAQQSATGTGYDRRNQQLINMNGWVYTAAAGGGSVVQTGTPGIVLSNYSTAWPSAIGSTPQGASVVGAAYGSLSTGSPTGAQGVARMNGNYAAIKLMMPGYAGDPRFTFNAEMASKSCAGPMLDNAFYALDGAGNIGNACLDGVNIANGTAPAYPSLNTPQEVMARGIYNFFDQVKTMVATYGSAGSQVIPMANMGQYCNKSEFGTACLTGGLANMMVGGFIEGGIGANYSPEWRIQPSAPTGTYALQLKDNLYLLQDFLIDHSQTTRLPILMVVVPPTSGTSTCQFPVLSGGVYSLQTVATGTALEYQVWRYAHCLALLCGAVIGPSTHNYDYATLRYYEELGDDSLTLINVPKGYLGTMVNPRPTAATIQGVWTQDYLGPTGTKYRVYWNPRGNGVQTIALGATYQALQGTQSGVNNGAQVTTLTLQDGDGRILQGPLSSVSISGNTATITGSGFGTKPGTAAPLFYNNFNNSPVGSTPSAVGLTNSIDATVVNIQNDRAYIGTQSLKGVFPANTESFPEISFIPPANTSEIYVSGAFYWTTSAPGSASQFIWKLTRMGCGALYHGVPQQYMTTRPDATGTVTGGDWGYNDGGGTVAWCSSMYYSTNPLPGPHADQWNFLEFAHKFSNPSGGSTGYSEMRCNSQNLLPSFGAHSQFVNQTTGANLTTGNTNNSGATANYTWVITFFDGLSVPGNTNTQAWLGFLYIDNCRNRVVVSDNVVLANSTKTKILMLICSTWGNTQVVGTNSALTTMYPSGSTAVFHVFDGTGTEVATYSKVMP